MNDEQLSKAHRWFAVECNNRAWDLASTRERTLEQGREMLSAAYAAAFHWSKAGAPTNMMRVACTLAHVHSLLGHAAFALENARQCLAFCETNPCEDWDLAFAHMEMALAAAVNADKALHKKHYVLAQAKGQAIKEKEDRDVFLAELARVPKPAP